jgi:hypothetical protein
LGRWQVGLEGADEQGQGEFGQALGAVGAQGLAGLIG